MSRLCVGDEAAQAAALIGREDNKDYVWALADAETLDVRRRNGPAGRCDPGAD